MIVQVNRWRLAVCVLILASAIVGWGAPASRPNILFVFIDDSGWGDLSCYGSPVTNKLGEVITPNLDRLASQGIRFTQGYVASPICSPSRTAVLTGIEPTRYAIHSYLDNKAFNASRNMANWVQGDTVAGPRIFKKAGYRTGQFGKWHMGGGRDVNDAPFPQDYGFEESLVAFEGMGNRILYNGDSLSQQNADVPGTIEWVERYQGAVKHTDAALKFITNAISEGKPFYVHVPYNDTHSPYNVPPGQEHDFDHITSDSTAQLFLGELHNLDKQVARLVAAVDGLGVGSNTLIVVVGDNGAPNDSINAILKRNGGLRGGKGNIYEGGIREPFFIRWTGTVPAGRVNSTTAVSTYDLLPTYLSFAGIPLPNAPFMGEDMSDVFKGATRPRVRPLFWEYGAASGLSPASPKLGIRQGNYKFMRNPDGSRREFYLIPQDHAEATNLVGQGAYAGVVSNLEDQLMSWYDQHVLGNIGEEYPCGSSNFTGLVMADAYTVTGGNSPGTGFAADAGVNYDFAGRASGAGAGAMYGYRLGATGGTSPRQASDFSIVDNRLTVAARNGNGRFELSPDGTSGFDFGGYLAGRNYEMQVQMNISVVGSTYAQRMSLSLADVSNVAVGSVDIGVQIGTDGAGGLGVFKRVAGGSNSGGNDINTRLMSGLPINTPISLKVRVTDYNGDVTNFNSSYEILVNDVLVDSGAFRFNDSTTSRYVIFDVAAHEGPVTYDNFQLTVTGGSTNFYFCHQPILGVTEYDPGAGGPHLRLHWSAQPGLSVLPEASLNLVDWLPLTNAAGAPLIISTPQGTIQWLEAAPPFPAESGAFFRLRRQ